MIAACYEAGPCGYGVYRQLSELGVACMVVAPSLVPKAPGDRVKTDRRDAMHLAELHRSELLTPVWVPNAEHEALRDLVRAREQARQDPQRARQRLSKFLLRLGLKPPTGVKSWSKGHHRWLDALRLELPAQHLVLGELVPMEALAFPKPADISLISRRLLPTVRCLCHPPGRSTTIQKHNDASNQVDKSFHISPGTRGPSTCVPARL